MYVLTQVVILELLVGEVGELGDPSGVGQTALVLPGCLHQVLLQNMVRFKETIPRDFRPTLFVREWYSPGPFLTIRLKFCRKRILIRFEFQFCQTFLYP